MASFKFSIGQVNITDYLLVIVHKSTEPLAEAARLSFPGPQPPIRNIEFDDLDEAIYYFEFLESSDGVDLGILLGTYTADVKSQRILLERRFYYVGGDGEHDPAVGSNQIVDSYLDGKTIAGVFKEGFRYLVSPDYTYKEYDLVEGGGVQLVGDKTFSVDEVVMIEITYLNATSSAGAVNFPVDFLLKTDDFTFDATCYNNVIEANKAGSILTIVFPSLSSIPDGTKFGINTHGGAQRNVVMQLGGGDYALIDGNQRNVVYVGKGEEVVFQKKGLYLRVVSWTGDRRRVGELVQQDIAPLNGLAEIGGWQLMDAYPRLFYWYVGELPAGQLGTGTYPNTPDANNKTKWIIDHTNAVFWIPDSRGLYNKATDGVNPGLFAEQSLQDHRHWTIVDLQRANSSFPESRDTQLTPLRSPIRYWNKTGGGAEGYDLDSEPTEPTLGRTSLPTTPAGVLMNSGLTQPKSVYRNFYRIT